MENIDFIILVTMIIIGANTIFSIIIYKLLQNYEDLGKQKVPCTILEMQYNRKPFYMLKIEIEGKQISQVISTDDLTKYQDAKEIEVCIRKYKNKFLNPNGTEYEFALAESTNWAKKDRMSLIKSSIVIILIAEFLVLCIGLQLDTPKIGK